MGQELRRIVGEDERVEHLDRIGQTALSGSAEPGQLLVADLLVEGVVDGAPVVQGSSSFTP